MPSFVSPQYTKAANPKTGNLEPCYTFPIEFSQNEEGITFVAENQSDITLQTLQKQVLENLAWWNNFIGQFLQASSKLFSKPYTTEQINKITKHTLNISTNTTAFPASITLLPKSIQIVGGVFIVNWMYLVEPVIIDIPDLAETEHNTDPASLPVPDRTITGIKELDIDEIPVQSNSTDDVFELDSPAKFYEKQRVKEARLKAKLAVYKAQRQMAQYYDKYGDDISDSDSGSSDDESIEENEEEVQF